jgi:hypothetical protein
VATIRLGQDHECTMNCIVAQYCIAFGKGHSMGGVTEHKTETTIALI